MKNQQCNSPFFKFLDPVLKYVDEGAFFKKPFMWLYIVIAVLNLVIPIAALVTAINGGVFDRGGTVIFGFILLFIVICGLSWFGAQIWWNRSSKVLCTAGNNAEFVVIPVFSHFIQTLGEWIGMWVGFGGLCLSLIAALFMAGSAYKLSALGLSTLGGMGLLGCILYPIYGFIVVVIARVFAELLRALVAIANNTRNPKMLPEPKAEVQPESEVKETDIPETPEVAEISKQAEE